MRVLAYIHLILFVLALGVRPAPAQSTEPLAITLEEALQIALVNNHVLQQTRLDVDNAQAQIREAWGEVLPQVDLQSSYTRNLKSANPFAGSEAGGLFSSFGMLDWLAFNEEARTDEDPSTEPISLDEFFDRQQSGLDDAGLALGGGDNPFAVPNEFSNGITISQTLFNGSAFAAIKGAEQLEAINERAVDRQQQLLIHDVRQSFYAALLAQRQLTVVEQSVSRMAETLDETTSRVSQGVAPKFERLSAQVELANLETEIVNAQNLATQSVDNLKLQLGIPIDQPLRLRGELEANDPGLFVNVSTQSAVNAALERRPDLQQAQLAVELRRIDRSMTRAQYFPQVNLFANMNYVGRVPDNRTVISSVDGDPFTFRSETEGFFSQSYWNPSVNAGVRLTWNLFNGFQTSSRLQQRQIAVNQAELDYDRQYEAVQLDVQNALRDLEAARRRILAQEQNVDRAELNYEYAQQRLYEGVASHLEERNASEQLDQSRLNFLQAVHDYLVARSAFETAVGMPLRGENILNLTSN